VYPFRVLPQKLNFLSKFFEEAGGEREGTRAEKYMHHKEYPVLEEDQTKILEVLVNSCTFFFP